MNASYNMAEVEKNSVGFLWSTIPMASSEQVAAAFEKFTVASYASEFSKYSGETITLLPAEKTLGADKIVETEIVPADGSAPTRLDYVVATVQPAGRSRTCCSTARSARWPFIPPISARW